MIRLLILLAVLPGGLLAARPAWALFDAEGLDPAFCRQPTVRQTVVYVDDMAVVDGQTDWATKLTSKLRATLTPGERVTVVRLSPGAGQSRELWSGCWPAYTAEQRAKIAGETYILTASPLTRLGDQQKYFVHDFGVALTAIYADAKRPLASVQVKADHAPAKQIIRALASDEGRFANSQQTVRAIVYSDMAENSDLGSVFNPASVPQGLGKTLGTYLRRSVFYAYGVGDDVSGDPGFAEKARRFWGVALKSLSATLAGMGSDLNVANALPVRSYASRIMMVFDGQELDGRVSVLADTDGTLVDSWLGVSQLGTVALAGTFRCDAANGACRLEATTSTGLATNAPSETLSLSGPAKAMTGQLGLRPQKLSYPVRTVADE